MKHALRLLSSITFAVGVSLVHAFQDNHPPVYCSGCPGPSMFSKQLQPVAWDEQGTPCLALQQGTPNQQRFYTSADLGKTWRQAMVLEPTLQAQDIFLYDLDTNENSKFCTESGRMCLSIEKEQLFGVWSPVVYALPSVGVSITRRPIVLPIPSIGQSSRITRDQSTNLLTCERSGLLCTLINNSDEGIPVIYTTSDSGHTWSLTEAFNSVPGSSATTLNTMSCDISGNTCVAGGDAMTPEVSSQGYGTSIQAILYTTLDGGKHWQDPVLLPKPAANQRGIVTITGIACDNQGLSCTAVAAGGTSDEGSTESFSIHSTDSGHSWTEATPITFPNEEGSHVPLSINCDKATAQHCLVVGLSVSDEAAPQLFSFNTDNGGLEWTKLPMLDANTAALSHRVIPTSCDLYGLLCKAM